MRNYSLKRYNKLGRDISDLPVLWSDEDCWICLTQYSHPSITSGFLIMRADRGNLIFERVLPLHILTLYRYSGILFEVERAFEKLRNKG